MATALLKAKVKAVFLIALLSVSRCQVVPPALGQEQQGVSGPFGDNSNTGPFTFDGFEFGFGGINVNDPNLLSRAFTETAFRRLFNNPFIAYITQGLPNQIRRPTDYLPQFLRGRVQRDVTQLFGWDYPDRLLSLAYTLPTSSAGAIRPAGCIAPIIALNINGGNCTVSSSTGEVVCSTPTLTLSISPLTCTGFWRSGCALAGPSVRTNVQLSPLRGGYLTQRPGVFDFGSAFNLTRVQLGFNVNSRRILNDFGATRYYFYLISFLGYLFLRAARALTATPLPTLLRNAALAITGSRPTPGSNKFRDAYASDPQQATADLLRAASSGNVSATDEALTSWIGELLDKAANRLNVDRKAMPAVDALYQNPEELTLRIGQELQQNGFEGLAQILKQGAIPVGNNSDLGNAAGAQGPSNRITNEQLGPEKYGTFDARGAYNPTGPTTENATSALKDLLWRRTPGTNGTAQDVLYEQLGQQMRRLLPSQAQVLDEMQATESAQLAGDHGPAAAGLLAPDGGLSTAGLFEDVSQPQIWQPQGLLTPN